MQLFLLIPKMNLKNFIRFTFGKLWGGVDHRFYLNTEKINASVCFLGVTIIRAILYHFHERTLIFAQLKKST